MTKRKWTKSKAVIISDVHYNMTNLPLADAAMEQAITLANLRGTPLIIAGDLHDTKANLRGECVHAMITAVSRAKHVVYILRGNHDQISEKSQAHSLEFLRPYATIIDYEQEHLGLHFIPYANDPSCIRAYLSQVPVGSTLIMHQGIKDANSGEYYQDKSAITHADVADYRVISGHYHYRQVIGTGKGNTFSYVGNPYTLNFGEASDPQKGFQVLHEDGSLEFIPTNLRRHVVINVIINDKGDLIADKRTANPEDLVWVKVTGDAHKIAEWGKESIGRALFLPGAFRYEATPDVTQTQSDTLSSSLRQADLLDKMIDESNLPDERKKALKDLWKELL